MTTPVEIRPQATAASPRELSLPISRPFTRRQLDKAGERRRQLITVAAGLDSGQSVAYAAARAGLSRAALTRLLKLAPPGTDYTRCRWLISQQTELLAPGISTGRPRKPVAA